MAGRPVVVSEVYRVMDEPRLVEDLGLPDRRILTNAYNFGIPRR